MNQSTIQPPTPATVPPTDPTVTASRLGLQYVTINADTTKNGGDWIANVAAVHQFFDFNLSRRVFFCRRHPLG